MTHHERPIISVLTRVNRPVSPDFVSFFERFR